MSAPPGRGLTSESGSYLSLRLLLSAWAADRRGVSPGGPRAGHAAAFSAPVPWLTYPHALPPSRTASETWSIAPPTDESDSGWIFGPGRAW